MKYGRFIKDKMILLLGMIFIIAAEILMGNAFKAELQYIIASACLTFFVLCAAVHIEYFTKKKYYDGMRDMLETVDQKYLIAEMIRKPDFIEGQILADSLYLINKSMKERINSIEYSVAEFKEYLELWIHEIKVPISALKLMNYNGNTDLVRQKQQIDRINYYVEQILFYARADAAEKDYLLNSCNLETILNKVIMDHKTLLMEHKIKVEKEGTDISVVTDSKWLEYMISQVLSNSIKYIRHEVKPCIRFYVEEDDRMTTLCVEDNGIGIPHKDLPYIFDKTFTGENGRKDSASTGMGLYICKKLADKIGHGLSIESKEGEYTRVKLSFGKDEFVQMS